MTPQTKTNLTLTEAEAMLRQLVAAKNTHHTLPLAKTHGTILASTITAPIDVPGTHVAAVDGFAFNHKAATSAKFRLKIGGEAKAGHPLTTPFAPATAIAITTGAAIPTTSETSPNNSHNDLPDTIAPDTIAMSEDCQVSADKKWVTLPATIKPHANFRRRGENIRAGDLALPQGHRLGAAEIGLAAALGLTDLPVMKPLTIAILSTGDELATKITSPPNPTQIYDSNRPMLATLLSDDGHKVLDGGIARDSLAATKKKYSDLLAHADALITSGGSAGSQEDHVKQAITALGGSLDFWQLRIKPGRPFAFGRINHKPIFCIPGNPVAVVITYRLLVSAALMRLAGGNPSPPLYLEAISGSDLSHKPGRDDFVRATITHTDPDYPDKPVAHPHGRSGAGILTSVIGADGLLHIPTDRPKLARGDPVPFLPWRKW